MATASEIKSRIAGVQDTKKITDAMYMISSVKMRRATKDFEGTVPYFDTLTEKISQMLGCLPRTESHYFSVPAREACKEKSHGVLLITADKGLAGAYNQDVLRCCESFMQEHPNTTLFVIGEFGRQYFTNHKLPFRQDFHYSLVSPSLFDARKICTELLEYYDSGELDEISIIYTDYLGARPGVCRVSTLLPLDKADFRRAESAPAEHTDKKFLPDAKTVLDGIVPSYVMGYIYGCLVKSFCSEQQSRMMAMKNAGDNAEEMLRTLKVQYNKIRQATITNEMIEITAGVRALKRQKTSASGDLYYDNE